MINTKKIKGKMAEKGLTQSTLAGVIGMAQATLSQKINNQRPMDIQEAYEIQKALEIPDHEFGTYFFA